MERKYRTFKVKHVRHVFSADSINLCEEETGLAKHFTLELDPEHYQSAAFGKADEVHSLQSFLQGVCSELGDQINIEIEWPVSLAHQCDLFYRDLMRVFSPSQEPSATMQCEECGPYLLHNSFDSRVHITLSRPEDYDGIIVHIDTMHENFTGEI